LIDDRGGVLRKGPNQFTVDDHFAGKAAVVQEVYIRLMAALRRIGPFREEPKKTSIHLVRSSALAGVEVRKEYLVLNIKTDYRIESPRVVRCEQLSARRFHHKVKLSSPRKVDAELQRWLKDAYELSG
jgi:hypothetical protein